MKAFWLKRQSSQNDPMIAILRAVNGYNSARLMGRPHTRVPQWNEIAFSNHCHDWKIPNLEGYSWKNHQTIANLVYFDAGNYLEIDVSFAADILFRCWIFLCLKHHHKTRRVECGDGFIFKSWFHHQSPFLISPRPLFTPQSMYHEATLWLCQNSYWKSPALEVRQINELNGQCSIAILT